MPDSLLAEISWHHLHPILVNFTAALVPASVGSDLLAKIARRQSLSHAAWWMLLYAAIVTPMTAMAGWFWKRRIEAGLAAETISQHQWIGISLAVGFIGLAIWRGAIHLRDEKPGLLYFLLAFAIVAALMYEGNLGGSMVFG
ncbi:MAG: DUF2231 domain-containing protein [Blastocatellales bacterium]